MGLKITNADGLARIRLHLRRAAALDCTELMEEGARILREDNERRALAGLDCEDRPMPPTRREMDPDLSRRRGSGPPLAPNRIASRVIRLVQVTWTTAAPWASLLRWAGFDANNGRPVLGMHANPGGGARYPRRDVISRPTPTAVKRFRQAARDFVRAKLRYNR